MRITSTRSSHRAPTRLFTVLVLLLVSSIVPAVPTVAAPTHTDIVSAGPLSTIFLANDLSQQIQHTGDSSFEFYSPGAQLADAGTLLAVNGALFGPDFP